jgi:hypothetical protein
MSTSSRPPHASPERSGDETGTNSESPEKQAEHQRLLDQAVELALAGDLNLSSRPLSLTTAGWVFVAVGVALTALALSSGGELSEVIGMAVFGLLAMVLGGLVVYFTRPSSSPTRSRPPKGKRRVPMSETTVHTDRGTSYRRTYRLVDDDVSDAEVQEMQREIRRKPWLARPEWEDGRFTTSLSRAASGERVGFLTSVVLCALGVVILLEMSDPLALGIHWLLGLLPIGMVYSAYKWWGAVQSAKNFADPEFRLDGPAGVLGDAIRGSLMTGIPTRYSLGDGLVARLSCIERTVELDRVHRKKGLDHKAKWRTEKKVHTETLWRTEQTLSTTTRGHSDVVGGAVHVASVSIELPGDLPPSTPDKLDDRIIWTLAFTAPLRGPDWSVEWEVPVFAASTLDAGLTGGRRNDEA